jgi:hypothetical protein
MYHPARLQLCRKTRNPGKQQRLKKWTNRRQIESTHSAIQHWDTHCPARAAEFLVTQVTNRVAIAQIVPLSLENSFFRSKQNILKIF